MGNPTKGTRQRWIRNAASVVACSTTLSLAATLVTPVARAQDGTAGSSASSLVAAISDAQARLDELDLGLGDKREAVNRALVDLHDAQSRAEQARRGAEEARRRLTESESAVEEARLALAEITRSQYRSQGSPSALGGLAAGGVDAQKDVLDRSLYLRQQVQDKQAKLDEVERARTEAANEESTLRQASRYADRSAAEAESAEAEARAQLETSQRELESQQAQRAEAVADLDEAKEELDTARPGSTPQSPEQSRPTVGKTSGSDSEGETTSEAEVRTEGETGAGTGNEAESSVTTDRAQTAEPESQPALSPEITDKVRQEVQKTAPEAPAPSDEVISSAVSTAQQAAARAGETLSDPTVQAAAIAAAVALIGSSQAEHSSFDNPYSGGSSEDVIAAFSRGLSSVLGGEESAEAPSSSVEELLPEVDSSESVTDKISSQIAAPSDANIETVIARAESMIGTPYVWGGGDANGPTAGLEGGQKGFDCSGLVIYAFAAAGISLPHYTGYQYQRGTQIDPSQAQRGDLLFWGPEGSQHVAIYLGDGTMIEAPQSGQNVQISPVRYSGMAAKAVRLL